MKEFPRPELMQLLSKGAQELGISLSAIQTALLVDYLALLSKWNAVYNLTAVRDPKQMVTHHLLDSLAIVPAFVEAKNVLDVGSGGGLPGIVLAIWATEAQPHMLVSMVDSVHKKTAFLTQVKAELKLNNVSIYTSRVEQLQVAHKFDVITSRAFANLSQFVKWCQHLLMNDGQFIAMKGAIANSDEAASTMPNGWHITGMQRLAVPGLTAERHLVFIKRTENDQ